MANGDTSWVEDVKIVMLKGEKGDGVQDMENLITAEATARANADIHLQEQINVNTSQLNTLITEGYQILLHTQSILQNSWAEFPSGSGKYISTPTPYNVGADAIICGVFWNPFTGGLQASSLTDSLSWTLASDGNFSATITTTNTDVLYNTGALYVVYATPHEVIDQSAEVEDIRIGYDGHIYSTAGDAVRGQISDLSNALDTTESSLNAKIGNLSNLETTDKSNIVNAVNELEELFSAPTQEAVDNWLDEHPEATTSVQDYSLTEKKLVKGTLGYVTPEMYGAVGDGITDDYQAIHDALTANDNVLLKGKSYYVSETIKLDANKKIFGINRNISKLIFPNNVDGVQINHSTRVENISIEFNGESSGILMYTPDNSNYALSSIVDNVRIIHGDNDNTKGSAIKLVAEKNGNAPYGAYNILFSNIDIRNSVKYGVQLLNKVKTTASDEAWINDVKFYNVFVNSADTAFNSDWEDISGNNSVPTTGNASVNDSITLINFNAQYVANITKCFMNIQNVHNINLFACNPFDYYHLRYDLNLPLIILNATSNMCTRVDLGLLPEVAEDNLSKYISFANATSFKTDMVNSVVRLKTLNAQLGDFRKLDNSRMFPLLPNGFNRDTVISTFPELVNQNSIQYAGFDSNGYFVIGSENTSGGGVQISLTTSLSTSPKPVIRCRLRYNGNWLTEQKFTTETL